MQQESNPRVLGVFTLAMISVSAIIALRNLPYFAVNGLSSAFFLLTATLLFFIPISLVCAELASGWALQGGIYAWVKEAFGEQAAALAIWMEWIESVVWLPLVLVFISSTFAYLIDPILADNRAFLLIVMLLVLWGGTFLNFKGMKTSGLVSSVGIILGSIIPGITIIALAIGWMIAGNPVHIDFTLQALLPEQFDLKTMVYFTGILLGFAGIEVAAFHVKDTQNPSRTYPKATFIAAVTIISIYVIGALAIAVVVPKEEITLHAGVMQALSSFLGAFGLAWTVPIFAGFILIGAFALLNTWIIGPSKGLLASALNGDFPKFTQKTNAIGQPVAILFMQAFIGSFLIFTYSLLPTVSSAYFMLTILASQLILVMYFFVFISCIKLRYSQPDVPRPYKIRGGKVGVWLIAGIGILSCIGAFLVGFVPPEEFDFGHAHANYALILIAGLVLFSAPPFVCHYFKQRREKMD